MSFSRSVRPPRLWLQLSRVQAQSFGDLAVHVDPDGGRELVVVAKNVDLSLRWGLDADAMAPPPECSIDLFRLPTVGVVEVPDLVRRIVPPVSFHGTIYRATFALNPLSGELTVCYALPDTRAGYMGKSWHNPPLHVYWASTGELLRVLEPFPWFLLESGLDGFAAQTSPFANTMAVHAATGQLYLSTSIGMVGLPPRATSLVRASGQIQRTWLGAQVLGNTQLPAGVRFDATVDGGPHVVVSRRSRHAAVWVLQVASNSLCLHEFV